MRRRSWGLWVLVVSLLLGVWAEPAAACLGIGIGRSKTYVPPAPASEEVLLVYSSEKKRQHFIRQIEFERAETKFGFIVPVPSKPEVAAEKDTLFKTLGGSCRPIFDGGFGIGGGGIGYGSGLGASGRGRSAQPAKPPVQIIEKKKLGDFTSFTLKATDGGALDGWLKRSGFEVKPEAKAWLDHYAKLEFFFVALRYDGGGEGTAKVLSKTLRISFDTPNPYYPYFEPSGLPKDNSRKLVVRVASETPFVPLARLEEEGDVGARLVRPWSEAATCGKQKEHLEEHLSKKVVDDMAERPLQVFVDLKPSREGFGDVLLVPAQPEGCDEACVKQRQPLLALLEPSLKGSETEPASLVIADPQVPPFYRPKKATKPAAEEATPYLAPRAAHCGVTAGAAGKHGGLVGLLALGLLLRRRKWSSLRRRVIACSGLSLLLLSCDETPKPEAQPAPSATASISAAPAPSASARPPAPPVEDAYAMPADKAAREKDLLKLLSGHPVGWFPARSTAGKEGLGRAIPGFGGLIFVNVDAAACVDDPRVEGVAYYRVENLSKDAGAPAEARVWGHLPKSVNECLTKQLNETKPSDLFGGVHSGRAYVGTRTAEQQKHRAKLKGRYVSSWGTLGRSASGRVRFGPIRMSRKKTLPPEVVRRILRQNYGRFRLCYDRGAKAKPKLAGSLGIKVIVGESGAVKKVTSVKPSSVEISSGLVKQCVRESLYGLSFPKPEDGKRFDFTFELKLEPAKK